MLGELYTWAYLRSDPLGFIARIENELLLDLELIEFDKASAEVFGRVPAGLLKNGLDISRAPLRQSGRQPLLTTRNSIEFTLNFRLQSPLNLRSCFLWLGLIDGNRGIYRSLEAIRWR